MERENVSLKIENCTLKTSNDQQQKKVSFYANDLNIIIIAAKFLQISALEAHICKTEAQIDTLLYRLNNANDIIRHMKQEVIFFFVLFYIN